LQIRGVDKDAVLGKKTHHLLEMLKPDMTIECEVIKL
jgi:hypothetical protein